MHSIDGPVKILIVDDHPVMREGLKVRLASQPDWTVCGEAETQFDAMRIAQEMKPDLVIVDLTLHDGSGLELIKSLATLPNAPRSLVVSMLDEKLYAERVVQAGACGFLHKQEASDKLISAIHRVLSGKLFLSEVIIDQVMANTKANPDRGHQNPVEQLTDRELQVFEAIGRGMTVAQIAAMLFLSTKTVETYRERAKQKLNLHTAAELARYAIMSQCVHRDDDAPSMSRHTEAEPP